MEQTKQEQFIIRRIGGTTYADVLDIDSLPDPKEKKNISEFIDLKCESVEIKEAA